MYFEKMAWQRKRKDREKGRRERKGKFRVQWGGTHFKAHAYLTSAAK